MTRLTIELPDELKAKAEARAAESGHASVEEYLAWLIQSDANGASADYGAPANLTFHTQDQLEAMLLSGQASPTSEMTAEDWADLRRRLLARHLHRAG